MSPSVVNSLPVALSDVLLACHNAELADAALQKALRGDLARQYGPAALLRDAHQHLDTRASSADEVSRLWISAVMLLLQRELDRKPHAAELNPLLA